MTRDDVIRLAREVGADVTGFINYDYGEEMVLFHPKELERFAALVIANHPPQSYMTWQEGYEAGKQAERERLQAFMKL